MLFVTPRGRLPPSIRDLLVPFLKGRKHHKDTHLPEPLYWGARVHPCGQGSRGQGYQAWGRTECITPTTKK